MDNNSRHCIDLQSIHFVRTVHIIVNINMHYLKFHEFYVFVLKL